MVFMCPIEEGSETGTCPALTDSEAKTLSSDENSGQVVGDYCNGSAGLHLPSGGVAIRRDGRRLVRTHSSSCARPRPFDRQSPDILPSAIDSRSMNFSSYARFSRLSDLASSNDYAPTHRKLRLNKRPLVHLVVKTLFCGVLISHVMVSLGVNHRSMDTVSETGWDPQDRQLAREVTKAAAVLSNLSVLTVLVGVATGNQALYVIGALFRTLDYYHASTDLIYNVIEAPTGDSGLARRTAASPGPFVGQYFRHSTNVDLYRLVMTLLEIPIFLVYNMLILCGWHEMDFYRRALVWPISQTASASSGASSTGRSGSGGTPSRRMQNHKTCLSRNLSGFSTRSANNSTSTCSSSGGSEPNRKHDYLL